MCLVATGMVSAGAADAQEAADLDAILERLERLEQVQREQAAEIRARDARIAELEAELGIAAEEVTEPAPVPAEIVVESDELVADAAANAVAEDPGTEPEFFGQFFRGGRGFQVASTPVGDLNISAWTYGRYLNQNGLDDTYTDAFGRTSELDLRHDLQLQKLMLYFKGWMFDPKLRYMTYIWTCCY